MTAYSPTTKAVPSSPKRSRDKREAEAAAAAEREVIEETDAWNDVSDDEEFSKRASNVLSRRRPLQPQRTPPPPLPLSSSPAQSSTAKSDKPIIMSGSGLGIWDIPSNNNGQARNQTDSIDHHQAQPSSAGARSSGSVSIPGSSSELSGGGPARPLDSFSISLNQALPDLAPSPIRPDFAELIRDPAHVLKQEQEPEELPQPSASRLDAPLPWEAVIPAELVSPSAHHQQHHLAPSFGSSGPGSEQQSDVRSPQKQASFPPITPTATTSSTTINHSEEFDQKQRREAKFLKCLSQPSVDVVELRKLSWSGIPNRFRSMVWQILLGYLPTPSERRVEVLKRKRKEYGEAVRLAFGKGKEGLDLSIWHQIEIDVLRTNSTVPIWQFQTTKRSLERILYVWAIRHPASGYVQGINDLVTSFFQVFISVYIQPNIEVESFDTSLLPLQVLESIEADSFWCLSKLLDGIQDNYIFAQPGIQRSVARMKELCKRVDARLHQHLEDEKVEFIQFAFRWINCLLMRELSTKKIIRMWDTYLAEGTNAFSEFHLYVCVAFLVKYSDQLRSMDFQSIIIFLQALPTEEWTEKDTELVLSQAFMWYSLFQGATGHFERK